MKSLINEGIASLDLTRLDGWKIAAVAETYTLKIHHHIADRKKKHDAKKREKGYNIKIKLY